MTEVEGNLRVNGAEIKQLLLKDKWYVRISIGGFMFFDSPAGTKQFAIDTHKNIIERLKWEND